MKRKGFILIVLLAACLYYGVQSATYKRMDIAGVGGYDIPIYVDTADTESDGALYINDTTFSDTFDVDTTYKYVNVMVYFASFDTGGVLGDDSTMDTLEVTMFTGFGRGAPFLARYCDTCIHIPCTIAHNFFVDTMVYNSMYFRTIIWDTLNPTTDDTNYYHGWIDILAGGTR
jgi:hypothetical protein